MTLPTIVLPCLFTLCAQRANSRPGINDEKRGMGNCTFEFLRVIDVKLEITESRARSKKYILTAGEMYALLNTVAIGENRRSARECRINGAFV